ncbi:hypothetical protein QA641_32850 [Bradyrhizobium sp. CB1650]|uniref:hypothetical protein n=1 Tax=Bradyrhizobium sp. CB1650 TaxID=3039153 RepID=UPI00243534C2|nr:hypothetical protein [Bradyrhizobium sp. CB1650]WGD50350.1 hypothetical protein QA641_32850 [Bradyrhizobium sp. CB1650]
MSLLLVSELVFGRTSSLFGEKFRPCFLIGNTLRHEVIVRSTGVDGRQLNQFAKILPCDGDLVVDVTDISREVGHGESPFRVRRTVAKMKKAAGRFSAGCRSTRSREGMGGNTGLP